MMSSYLVMLYISLHVFGTSIKFEKQFLLICYVYHDIDTTNSILYKKYITLPKY